ncbi:MAG: vitamin K epoxide reductase family protein [Chloroflexota bacterium]
MSVERSITAKALILLSLAGVAISGYLAYAKFAHADPFCAGLTSCAQVAASPYAEVRGVPVALLGVAYYALLAGLGVLLWQGRGGDSLGLALFGVALAGTLYSAYLTYVEFFVIHAVCLWCLASAAVTAAVLGLSLVGLLAGGQRVANEAP